MTGQRTFSREAGRLLQPILDAIGHLPATCRYHGTETAPRDRWFDACCDTGIPAQKRKEAMVALKQISDILSEWTGGVR